MIDDVTKEQLHEYLKSTRTVLVHKVDGLSEYDARRPLTASGTNLLGLVKHVTLWESRYLGEVFTGTSGCADTRTRRLRRGRRVTSFAERRRSARAVRSDRSGSSPRGFALVTWGGGEERRDAVRTSDSDGEGVRLRRNVQLLNVSSLSNFSASR